MNARTLGAPVVCAVGLWSRLHLALAGEGWRLQPIPVDFIARSWGLTAPELLLLEGTWTTACRRDVGCSPRRVLVQVVEREQLARWGRGHLCQRCEAVALGSCGHEDCATSMVLALRCLESRARATWAERLERMEQPWGEDGQGRRAGQLGLGSLLGEKGSK